MTALIQKPDKEFEKYFIPPENGEDIAKTVKFLALDGTYITAQVLGVDGGLTV